MLGFGFLQVLTNANYIEGFRYHVGSLRQWIYDNHEQKWVYIYTTQLQPL
jgi:hypothetical protein